jgi:hypothetical protein
LATEEARRTAQISLIAEIASDYEIRQRADRGGASGFFPNYIPNWIGRHEQHRTLPAL